MVVIRDTKHGNLALISGMGLTARDWSLDFAKLQNIDITLSTIDSSIKGTQPRNITHVAGTALTGRDWSSDFAKLQNLDVLLSNVRDTLDSSIKAVQPRNLTHIAGTALTARDWSIDFAKLQNLDTTLSSVRDNLNIAKVGGVAQTARDWSSDFAKLQNLDTTLTVLARLQRWGRDVVPLWVHGAEVTAPAAGTALVSRTVSTGKVGYIYGFFISAGEANDFRINWTSGGTAYSRRIMFIGKGSLQYVDFVPLNEGLPASSGTTITITNVNAGSAGVVYQACLLYAEV